MACKNEFIDFMLGAGVLSFGDFLLNSGRRAPYFVNTGNYKTGMQISALGDFYANCVIESGERIDALFGPAYKGITLVSATAGALYRNHARNLPFFFNRKEAKDHGEGGVIIGYTPRDGDRIAIIEDVVTSGRAVRESLDLIMSVANVTVPALYVSVDRMEKGNGGLSALQELKDEFGINVYPIITALDILDSLPEGDGRRAEMEGYLREYAGI